MRRSCMACEYTPLSGDIAQYLAVKILPKIRQWVRPADIHDHKRGSEIQTNVKIHVGHSFSS